MFKVKDIMPKTPFTVNDIKTRRCVFAQPYGQPDCIPVPENVRELPVVKVSSTQVSASYSLVVLYVEV